MCMRWCVCMSLRYTEPAKTTLTVTQSVTAAIAVGSFGRQRWWPQEALTLTLDMTAFTGPVETRSFCCLARLLLVG